MKLPFHRSKTLPVRVLQTAAAGAGIARLAIKQRTLRPHVMRPRSGNRVTRALRRG
jgi:hypothetical protein